MKLYSSMYICGVLHHLSQFVLGNSLLRWQISQLCLLINTNCIFTFPLIQDPGSGVESSEVPHTTEYKKEDKLFWSIFVDLCKILKDLKCPFCKIWTICPISLKFSLENNIFFKCCDFFSFNDNAEDFLFSFLSL